MHQSAQGDAFPGPQNRYILPTSLTAIACFFAILFAGAKIAQIAKSTDAPQTADSFAVVPPSVGSR